MATVAQWVVALSQGLPFFHAGDELLRSKSLDRDSYNSGPTLERAHARTHARTLRRHQPHLSSGQRNEHPTAPCPVARSSFRACERHSSPSCPPVHTADALSSLHLSVPSRRGLIRSFSRHPVHHELFFGRLCQKELRR